MVSAAGLRNAIRPSESTTYNASATAATARKSVSVDAPSPAGVITGTLSLLGDFRYWTTCLMAADQRRQTGIRTTGAAGRPPGASSELLPDSNRRPPPWHAPAFCK